MKKEVKSMVTKYYFRVLLSLLDGQWKTAPDIAREWHGKSGKGTVKEKGYKNVCEALTPTGYIRFLRSKFLYQKSKRNGKKYALLYKTMKHVLSTYWGILPSDVIKLLKLKIFQEFVKSNISPENRKNAEFFFRELYISASKHIAKNGRKKEQQLLARTHKNSLKANLLTPLQVLQADSASERMRKQDYKDTLKAFDNWQRSIQSRL